LFTIKEYINELEKFLKGEHEWREVLDEYESHLRAEFDEYKKNTPLGDEKSFIHSLEKPEVIYLGLLGKKSIFTSHEPKYFTISRFALSYIFSIVFMFFLSLLGFFFLNFIPKYYYGYSYNISPFTIIFWPFSLIPTNGIKLQNYFGIFTMFFFFLLILLFDSEFFTGLGIKKVYINSRFKLTSKFLLIYLFIGIINSLVAIAIQIILYNKDWIDPFYDFSPILLWVILIPFAFHWISIILALISTLILFLIYKFDILYFRTDLKKINLQYLADFQFGPFLHKLSNFLFAYTIAALMYFYSIFLLYYNNSSNSFIAQLHLVITDSILWPISIINILATYNYEFYSLYILKGLYIHILYSFLVSLFIFIFFMIFPVSKIIRLYTRQTKYTKFNKFKDSFGKIMIIYTICAIFNFVINISLVTWNNVRLFGYYSDTYDYDLLKETFFWIYYANPLIIDDWISHLPALTLFIILVTFYFGFRYIVTNKRFNTKLNSSV
jgi:hypothetical protein